MNSNTTIKFVYSRIAYKCSTSSSVNVRIDRKLLTIYVADPKRYCYVIEPNLIIKLMM